MNIVDRKKEIIITCPHCGMEYLPSELYMPKDFFGNPGEIYKTPSGNLEAYEGNSMNLVEEYTCDNCGTTFEVEADIKFRTKEKQADSFDEDYTSPIHINRISLFEGE